MPSNDEFLNIRLGARVREEKAPRMKRNKGRSAKRYGPIKGASAPAVKRNFSLGNRRVVVRARVVVMNAYGKTAARMHLNYLNREGTDQDQDIASDDRGRASFFDAEKSDIGKNDIQAVKENEPHQFRFIVSPEDAEQLDLTDYTRKFMAQVEEDLGRNLDWKAVNHYNTDNPHTHIVVSGLDQKNNEVFIDKEYISNGMRGRAVEIATAELGQRQEQDISRAIQKEIKEQKFTGLDRQIIKASSGQIFHIEPYADSPMQRINRSRKMGRLAELEKMGLVEKLSPNSWRLPETLTDNLKNLQHYKSAQERLNAVDEKLDNPSRRHVIHENNDVHKLSGVVMDKGYADELYDRGYLVVAEANGALHHYHVPSINSLEKVNVGSTVNVSVERDSPVKKADFNIASFSALNNGVWDSESFREWTLDEIAKQSKSIKLDQVDDYVDAHELRVKRLAGMNMVQELSGNQWRVPDSLVNDLEREGDLQITANKLSNSIRKTHHLSLDKQVQYAGKTTLDSVINQPLPTGSNGVTQKFVKAYKARKDWLQKQGLEPGTKSTMTTLDRMERRQVAEDFQKKSGLSYKPLSEGESVSEKVIGTVDTASMKRYVMVGNESAKEFSMVPWRSGKLPEQGQNMAIGVNKEGRAWTKTLGRDIQR